MSQAYNRTFVGVRAQHAALTYEVIDDIIKGSKIKRIVELGTAGGALSFYLGLCGKMLDIPVYTVDAQLPSDDARRMFRELGVFYFKLNVMEPEGITSVNSLISDEPVYLFCDNGNKAEEFTKYAPRLLPGSIISVHDWMYEVFPQQIGHIAAQLNFQPYREAIWDKNNLRMATWKVPDRGQKPVDYFGTSTKWRRGDQNTWHLLSVGGNFKAMGMAQLEMLKRNGLKPHHTLLDVGCGSLRLGVQAMGYLQPCCYFGIDCDEQMVKAGIQRELLAETRAEKQPSFTINKYFDLSEFGNTKFDFAIAQSVFTHLPPTGIELCLKNVMARINPGGKFFASYNLADNHITRFGQKYPDMTRYSFEYFETLARKYNFGLRNIGNWGIEQNRNNDQLLLAFNK
jgi:SAM-dependent methyltransferase/predicted O-methyltransferase YrrM